MEDQRGMLDLALVPLPPARGRRKHQSHQPDPQSPQRPRMAIPPPPPPMPSSSFPLSMIKHADMGASSKDPSQTSPLSRPSPNPRRLVTLIPSHSEIGTSREEPLTEPLPYIYKQETSQGGNHRSFSPSPDPGLSQSVFHHSNPSAEEKSGQRRFSQPVNFSGVAPLGPLFTRLSAEMQASVVKQHSPLSLIEGGNLDIDSLLASSPQHGSGDAYGRSIRAISRRSLLLKLPSSFCALTADIPALAADNQGRACLVVLPSDRPSPRSEAEKVEDLLAEFIKAPLEAARRAASWRSQALQSLCSDALNSIGEVMRRGGPSSMTHSWVVKVPSHAGLAGTGGGGVLPNMGNIMTAPRTSQRSKEGKEDARGPPGAALGGSLGATEGPRSEDDEEQSSSLSIAAAVLMADIVRQVEISCAERGRCLTYVWNAYLTSHEDVAADLLKEKRELQAREANLLHQVKKLTADAEDISYLRREIHRFRSEAIRVDKELSKTILESLELKTHLTELQGTLNEVWSFLDKRLASLRWQYAFLTLGTRSQQVVFVSGGIPSGRDPQSLMMKIRAIVGLTSAVIDARKRKKAYGLKRNASDYEQESSFAQVVKSSLGERYQTRWMEGDASVEEIIHERLPLLQPEAQILVLSTLTKEKRARVLLGLKAEERGALFVLMSSEMRDDCKEALSGLPWKKTMAAIKEIPDLAAKFLHVLEPREAVVEFCNWSTMYQSALLATLDNLEDQKTAQEILWRLPAGQRKDLMNLLDPTLTASLIKGLDPKKLNDCVLDINELQQGRILEALPPDVASTLLSQMAPVDAARKLMLMSDLEARNAILRFLTPRVSASIVMLMDELAAEMNSIRMSLQSQLAIDIDEAAGRDEPEQVSAAVQAAASMAALRTRLEAQAATEVATLLPKSSTPLPPAGGDALLSMDPAASENILSHLSFTAKTELLARLDPSAVAEMVSRMNPNDSLLLLASMTDVSTQVIGSHLSPQDKERLAAALGLVAAPPTEGKMKKSKSGKGAGDGTRRSGSVSGSVSGKKSTTFNAAARDSIANAINEATSRAAGGGEDAEALTLEFQRRSSSGIGFRASDDEGPSEEGPGLRSKSEAAVKGQRSRLGSVSLKAGDTRMDRGDFIPGSDISPRFESGGISSGRSFFAEDAEEDAIPNEENDPDTDEPTSSASKAPMRRKAGFSESGPSQSRSKSSSSLRRAKSNADREDSENDDEDFEGYEEGEEPEGGGESPGEDKGKKAQKDTRRSTGGLPSDKSSGQVRSRSQAPLPLGLKASERKSPAAPGKQSQPQFAKGRVRAARQEAPGSSETLSPRGTDEKVRAALVKSAAEAKKAAAAASNASAAWDLALDSGPNPNEGGGGQVESSFSKVPKNQRLKDAIASNRGAKARPLGWLMSVIESIYKDGEAVIKKLGKIEALRKMSVPELSFSFFQQKYGQKSVVEGYIGSLVNSISSHKKGGDIRLDIFSRFLSEEFDFNTFMDFLSCQQQLLLPSRVVAIEWPHKEEKGEQLWVDFYKAVSISDSILGTPGVVRDKFNGFLNEACTDVTREGDKVKKDPRFADQVIPDAFYRLPRNFFILRFLKEVQRINTGITKLATEHFRRIDVQMSGSIQVKSLPAYLQAMAPNVSETELLEMQNRLISYAAATEKDIPASDVVVDKIEALKEESFIASTLLIPQIVDYFKMNILLPSRADDEDDGGESYRKFLYTVFHRHMGTLMPLLKSFLERAGGGKIEQLQDLISAISKEVTGDGKLNAYMKLLSGVVSIQVQEMITMTGIDVDLEALDYKLVENCVSRLEDFALLMLSPDNQDLSYLMIDKTDACHLAVSLVKRHPRLSRMKKVGESLLLKDKVRRMQTLQAAYVFQSIWRENRQQREKG